jgi:hypothetical protein
VRQQEPAGTRPEVAQRSQPAERQAEFAQQPAGGRKTLKPFILTAENRTARAAGAVLPDPPPAVVPSVRVPTLALAPAPVRPVPRQSSGRLVWTGDLGRRGVVAFEGGSATVGSLVGRLPGVPSRFMVFPAEFKDDGIQVYTNDASRHNRTEAPGPSTGWNRMVYVWDPERVKQLIVVEAPNPGNQFSRLSLRNNRRSCPVIVVDWWTD